MDDALDKAGLRVDAVEIAVAVIITVHRVEVVLVAPVERDLVEGPRAIVAVPAIADVEAPLGDARRQAAIVFLGQTRRAVAVAPVRRRSIALMGVPEIRRVFTRMIDLALLGLISMLLGVVRLGGGRRGEGERRGARGEKKLEHL